MLSFFRKTIAVQCNKVVHGALVSKDTHQPTATHTHTRTCTHTHKERKHQAQTLRLVQRRYTPRDAPYVSHDEGLAIHTAFIEKFVASSVSMYDILAPSYKYSAKK
jgi:hypothetical protein